MYKAVFRTNLTGNPNARRSTEAKKYKKYSEDDVILEVLGFYLLPRGASLRNYCRAKERKVPISTMKHIFFNCRIFEMKLNDKCVGDVEKVLKENLAYEHAKTCHTSQLFETGPNR